MLFHFRSFFAFPPICFCDQPASHPPKFCPFRPDRLFLRARDLFVASRPTQKQSRVSPHNVVIVNLVNKGTDGSTFDSLPICSKEEVSSNMVAFDPNLPSQHRHRRLVKVVDPPGGDPSAGGPRLEPSTPFVEA